MCRPCVDATGQNAELMEAESGELIMRLLGAAAGFADEQKWFVVLPGPAGGGECAERDELGTCDVTVGELGMLAHVDEALLGFHTFDYMSI